MISGMVSAGLDGGYVANPRLAKVHWQASSRYRDVVRSQ
jgi:hypothetical protein